MKTIYNQVNLIAHRGLSGEFCENTLPAFAHASKMDFFGIETDIQFTKDNKIVCFHDKNTKRLMGDNYVIANTNYRDLKRKTFIWGNCEYKICTFKQYLKACKKHGKHCIIEIKYKINVDQLKMLIKIIKWHRYLKKCIIISFNSWVLQYLRELEPTLHLQLLVNNPIKHYVEFCRKYNIDASLYDKLIKKDTVAKLKAQGITCGVWTVNSKSLAQKLIDMGVKYITSDIHLS